MVLCAITHISVAYEEMMVSRLRLRLRAVPNASTIYYKSFTVVLHLLDTRRPLLCTYAGGLIQNALGSSTVVISERWSSTDDYFKVVSKNSDSPLS